MPEKSDGAKKGGVASMRLRFEEQAMFREIAQVYGLYGATNAVRAAGRVLVAMRIDMGSFISLLERYEKEHPDAEPCKFIVVSEEVEDDG